MLQAIKSHLQSNSGDTNVSKMIMVAIVFVVGAILLVMVTSATRGPIQHWYETVVVDWFDQSGKNGGYSYDNGWAIVGGEDAGGTESGGNDAGNPDDGGTSGGTGSGGQPGFVGSPTPKPGPFIEP